LTEVVIGLIYVSYFTSSWVNPRQSFFGNQPRTMRFMGIYCLVYPSGARPLPDLIQAEILLQRCYYIVNYSMAVKTDLTMK